jgi:DNA-binding Lrp family transcriptional regulator
MTKVEVKLDSIDLNILELLSKDGRAPITQISTYLARNGESLTSRTVWNRIKRLEKYKIIQGYTAILKPSLFARKQTLIILLKFAPLHDKADIDKLNSYIRGSSSCFFATQIIGEGAEGYDYACSLSCDTKQQLDSQLEIILNTFGNLISDYQVYNSKIIKDTPQVLQSGDNHEVRSLGSLHEQPDNELAATQDFISRCMYENVRSMAASAGITLD